MKHFIFSLALFVVMTAHAQLQLPAQSASASIKQTIGLTEVAIDYSRPSLRNRVIFGELLPYGEFWRVGANAATKITFSGDVLIDDNVLKKGTYSILVIPGKKTWQLNWYVHTSEDWNDYLKIEPSLQLTLPVQQRASNLETFELHFHDITMESSTLILEWEQSRLEIPIRVDEKEHISKRISRVLAGPSSFDYYFAALYMHETQTDLETALRYIQKANASESAQFFQVSREAFILNDLGKSAEAKRVAQKALELSREAGNNDFIRMNLKVINQ